MLLIVFGYACSWELYCPPQVTNTTHPYMQLLRRPPRLRKGGRSINYLAFFRHNTGHNHQDGSQAPRGQIWQVKGGNCPMDHLQEGKKARNYPYCGLTATCSQCRLLGKSLPLPDVHHSGKAKGDTLLHQAGCPVSLKHLLVAHLLD